MAPEYVAPDAETTIIKQAAAKLTAWGFPNNPYRTVYRSAGVAQTAGARAKECCSLSDTVRVWQITDLLPEGVPVYVLVIHKGHKPIEAHHVVDFRVGDNIYS